MKRLSLLFVLSSSFINVNASGFCSDIYKVFPVDNAPFLNGGFLRPTINIASNFNVSIKLVGVPSPQQVVYYSVYDEDTKKLIISKTQATNNQINISLSKIINQNISCKVDGNINVIPCEDGSNPDINLEKNIKLIITGLEYNGYKLGFISKFKLYYSGVKIYDTGIQIIPEPWVHDGFSVRAYGLSGKYGLHYVTNMSTQLNVIESQNEDMDHAGCSVYENYKRGGLASYGFVSPEYTMTVSASYPYQSNYLNSQIVFDKNYGFIMTGDQTYSESGGLTFKNSLRK